MAERSLRQWAAGEYESVQAACEKLVHVVDTVEPDPVLVEKYEGGGFSGICLGVEVKFFFSFYKIKNLPKKLG